MWKSFKKFFLYFVVALVVMVGFVYYTEYDLYFAHPNSHAPVAESLSSMKELQMALDLYYNDKLLFPESLNQLMPIYIQSIPVNKIFVKSLFSSPTNKAFIYSRIDGGKGYSLCGTFNNPPPNIVVDSNNQYCVSQNTGI